LIEFIYSTGARVSEVEGLKLKDLDLENNSAIVFGKGRKYRTVYLNRNAKEWLEKYLEIRSQFVYSKKNMSYQDGETNTEPGNSIKSTNNPEMKAGWQPKTDSLLKDHMQPGGGGYLFLNRFGKKLDVRSYRNILSKSRLSFLSAIFFPVFWTVTSLLAMARFIKC
jgi:integrase